MPLIVNNVIITAMFSDHLGDLHVILIVIRWTSYDVSYVLLIENYVETIIIVILLFSKASQQ